MEFLKPITYNDWVLYQKLRLLTEEYLIERKKEKEKKWADAGFLDRKWKVVY